jgi:hypothetical protein
LLRVRELRATDVAEASKANHDFHVLWREPVGVLGGADRAGIKSPEPRPDRMRAMMRTLRRIAIVVLVGLLGWAG